MAVNSFVVTNVKEMISELDQMDENKSYISYLTPLCLDGLYCWMHILQWVMENLWREMDYNTNKAAAQSFEELCNN